MRPVGERANRLYSSSPPLLQPRSMSGDPADRRVKELDGMASELALATSTNEQMETRLTRLQESREDLQKELDSVKGSSSQ